MAEPVFSYSTQVVLDHPAIGTGHVATRMAWEDNQDGKRRPGSTPEQDEHGRFGHVVDVLLPLGRDGAPTVFGVTVWMRDFEVPQVTPYMPVEFDGLRAYVRAHRSGKGVDVSFSADGMRQADQSGKGRRGAAAPEGEAA